MLVAKYRHLHLFWKTSPCPETSLCSVSPAWRVWFCCRGQWQWRNSRRFPPWSCHPTAFWWPNGCLSEKRSPPVSLSLWHPSTGNGPHNPRCIAGSLDRWDTGPTAGWRGNPGIHRAVLAPELQNSHSSLAKLHRHGHLAQKPSHRNPWPARIWWSANQPHQLLIGLRTQKAVDVKL